MGIDGSFYCTCHVGYSGDGVTCVGKIRIFYDHNQFIKRVLLGGNSDIPFLQILTNASQLLFLKNTNTYRTTVMLMLTVPTPRDRSTVPVMSGTREMESPVLVSNDLLWLLNCH